MKNKLNKIEEFQLFCLEEYRFEKDLDGESAFQTFEKYHVFEYLEEGFEVLHTQGRKYLVADIEEFINIRKEI